MLGFPKLSPNIPCNILDKKWKKSNDSLLGVWKNCTLGKPINYRTCCDQVLQCNDQNTWLKKNNIPYSCPPPRSSPGPHFGKIRSTHNFKTGVF